MISQGAVLDIARDAIYTILITSAPLQQCGGQYVERLLYLSVADAQI